ncbi:MAG: EamA family transporter [Micavibrio aeruginosavorus]|uniref:EamA family transporter n=1 Tax=Micavibrio aeruginosavorus TaxID=349221 RepID=A0A2W5MVK6_9BACT|nr:MAG: EamA family transporter [Micavibrio aeruginosavorus]
MSLSKKDYLSLFLILTIWAGNVIAIKLAVGETAPLTAATLRFAIAGLLFLPFIKKVNRQTMWTILQIAILMNVLHIGLLFVALKSLDAASTAILLQTQIVFATLLGWLFFNETIRWRTWTGIGVAALGVLLMCGEPDLANHPLSVVIMLVSTLALSFSFVKMKHLQAVHPATYIALMCLFSTPFLGLASLIATPESWTALPNINWHVFAPVLIFQCVLVSLSHILWQRLVHKGEIGKLTAYTLLSPFIAILMSVVFLGEHLDWPMIVGGILTMAGVGIITMRRIQKGIA